MYGIDPDVADAVALRYDRPTRTSAGNSGGVMAPTGISNRVSPDQEDQQRRDHPPIDAGSPPPQDAAGRVGEEAAEIVPNRQTSHKAGSRSIAQKEARARYPDRSMPPSRKVAGAFGREPRDVREPEND
jgi:hypothetical protein